MKILLRNSADPALFRYFNKKTTAGSDLEMVRASIAAFKDKESFARMQTIGGNDVYRDVSADDLKGEPVVLVQSSGTTIRASADEYALRTLITLRTLKDAGAGPIWLVEPYAGYMRQDKPTEIRDEDGQRTGEFYLESVSAKTLAAYKKFGGADGYSTVDIHSDMALGFYQDEFGADNVINVDPTEVYAEYAKALGIEDLVIVNPDMGADARAEKLRQATGFTERASASKDRKNAGIGPSTSSVQSMEGDVEGKDVLIIDDIFNTCGTAIGCARELKRKGAERIFAMAAAGTFGSDGLTKMFEAKAKNGAPLFEQIYVSNAISQRERIHNLESEYLEDVVKSRVKIMDFAPLLWKHITEDIMTHPVMQKKDDAPAPKP